MQLGARFPFHVAIIVVITGISDVSAESTKVRMSFLDEPGPVESILSRFDKLPSEMMVNFRRAVSNFYATPIGLDKTGFPQKKNGWYDFNSMDEAISALPHELWKSAHVYGLACFDAVLLLDLHALGTALRSRSISGPFLPPHTESDGSITLPPTATATDAYELLYPEWYRTEAESFFPAELHEKRVALLSLFFAGHSLPIETNEKSLVRAIEQTLHAKWHRYAVIFPENVEIVLVHQVSLSRHLFTTVHAGGLIRSGNHLLYLEKNGGQGPFVVLELNDRFDLDKWMRYSLRDAGKHGYSHLALSYNDAHVRILTLQTTSQSPE